MSSIVSLGFTWSVESGPFRGLTLAAVSPHFEEENKVRRGCIGKEKEERENQLVEVGPSYLRHAEVWYLLSVRLITEGYYIKSIQS